ncbi:hypothetical protein RHGRI_015115 [Rhododendron griersonianum]|uniref:THO1-MOS11 C-terminal domain-containing protein n=1 Tax=Rhododendron griersonianum TaxID=479676 RepID=A0AAV6KC36_9ERIC|nr:hypothetical protein RHGRI_015115 [Rhododendron griersonianum]
MLPLPKQSIKARENNKDHRFHHPHGPPRRLTSTLLSLSLSSTMATAIAKSTTAKDENPRKTPDQPQSPPPSDPLPADKDGGDESKPSAVKETDEVKKDDVVSSVQKKIRRAERFGMPVQLSEEEKRNSRAERFGTTSAVHESDTLKQSEEHKRKARAERFGLAQSVTADEEAKKKARLSRFGAVPAVPKANAQEEDKKKARALRFSQPPNGSLSQLDGKGNNIEVVKDCYCGQGWWGNLNSVPSFFYSKCCLK